MKPEEDRPPTEDPLQGRRDPWKRDARHPPPAEREASSGGMRTDAGSTYGDDNRRRDPAEDDALMGDEYSSGGGGLRSVQRQDATAGDSTSEPRASDVSSPTQPPASDAPAGAASKNSGPSAKPA